MAARGWMLKKHSILYTFEFAPPEQANIKMDYRHFKRQQDFVEYRTLMEDSGWRHIAGSKNSGNQYFMQTAKNGTDDIFSDGTSRAGRYKRLSEMMSYGFVVFLPFVLIAISKGTLRLDAFINPRALYYAPGLWELSGFDFWRNFLFETPFALMRGFSWSISLLLLISYVFLAIKSWAIYVKALGADEE